MKTFVRIAYCILGFEYSQLFQLTKICFGNSPTNALSAIILNMLSDNLENLNRYISLDEAIRDDALSNEEELPAFHGFMKDNEHSVLFIAREGGGIASTSWRETPLSREATAALRFKEEDFVLFLPGEPFIVKAEDEMSRITMRVLGGQNAS